MEKKTQNQMETLGPLKGRDTYIYIYYLNNDGESNGKENGKSNGNPRSLTGVYIGIYYPNTTGEPNGKENGKSNGNPRSLKGVYREIYSCIYYLNNNGESNGKESGNCSVLLPFCQQKKAGEQHMGLGFRVQYGSIRTSSPHNKPAHPAVTILPPS